MNLAFKAAPDGTWTPDCDLSRAIAATFDVTWLYTSQVEHLNRAGFRVYLREVRLSAPKEKAWAGTSST